MLTFESDIVVDHLQEDLHPANRAKLTVGGQTVNVEPTCRTNGNTVKWEGPYAFEL
jgi:hypothetical protein